MVLPHRSRLVALARRHGAGPDAEDVAQETLLRAARSDSISEDRPGPYLTRIALNLVVDRHRRISHEWNLRHHAGLIPRQRSLDDRAADRDAARRMLWRLARSEPPTTMAMILRYADGALANEIGREFGISACAAKARVLRALHRLRRRTRRPPEPEESCNT